MKSTNLQKVQKDKILDITYEPTKNRYSVLIQNSTRKEITQEDFEELLKGKK